MADYDLRPGGSLKLKGGVAGGGIVKKKRKAKLRSKLDGANGRDDERAQELLSSEDIKSTPGPTSGTSRASPSPSNGHERKTDAERRFEEAQRRRLLGKVARLAHKTHKDRVNEFNAKLELLSEHHDIPKVGPG